VYCPRCGYYIYGFARDYGEGYECTECNEPIFCKSPRTGKMIKSTLPVKDFDEAKKLRRKFLGDKLCLT
jgi:hypothetical protein